MTELAIAREWTCQRSGDCCRAVEAVVMTREEAVLIMKHPLARGRRLEWDKDPRSKFFALRAKPCPFLSGNACSIYEIRPYNCRRFGCFRPNPKIEPLDMSGEAAGDFACRNFADRFVISRVVRRAAVALQRKAQIWALEHGW